VFARLAERLAGSSYRIVLLIAQVNKLKCAASLLAVAHRGAYVFTGLAEGSESASRLVLPVLIRW